MTWHIVDKVFFSSQREEVKKLCRDTLGPAHQVTYRGPNKQFDNHGNWFVGVDGKFRFRYKKDITWFLLVSGHMVDPEKPWWPR